MGEAWLNLLLKFSRVVLLPLPSSQVVTHPVNHMVILMYRHTLQVPLEFKSTHALPCRQPPDLSANRGSSSAISLLGWPLQAGGGRTIILAKLLSRQLSRKRVELLPLGTPGTGVFIFVYKYKYPHLLI